MEHLYPSPLLPFCWCQGQKPGLCAFQANALPLSYSLSLWLDCLFFCCCCWGLCIDSIQSCYQIWFPNTSYHSVKGFVCIYLFVFLNKLCRPGCLELAMQTKLGLNSRSDCLSFPSAGIKGDITMPNFILTFFDNFFRCTNTFNFYEGQSVYHLLLLLVLLLLYLRVDGQPKVMKSHTQVFF